MNRLEKIQVEKEKERYGEKVATMVHGYYTVAIVVGLYNTYGFKEKRLKRALKSIIAEVEKLTSGMIGLTDYKQWLDEKIGFDWENLE